MTDVLPAGPVAIVGPGRVGTVLAAALEAAGHEIVAVGGGGEPSRTRFLARFPRAVASEDPAPAAGGAALVVLAVPDDAVERVVTDLALADAVRDGQRVVHVAGSLGVAPLRRASLAGARVAACHPAQTFATAEADAAILLGAAWAVTSAPEDRPWAHALVRQVGGSPYDVPEERRVLYHAGLAAASNATGAAVATARQLLLAAGIGDSRAFLAPLVAASVENVLADGAVAITGPVRRGDAGTVRRHLRALDADLPRVAEAYRHLSRAILAEVRPELSAEQVAGLERALAEPGAGEPWNG